MLSVNDYCIGNVEPAEIKKWCVDGKNQCTTMFANFNKKLFEEILQRYVNSMSYETKDELLKNRDLLYKTAWSKIPSFVNMEKENIVTMWELNCYEQAVQYFNQFKIMFSKIGKEALNKEIRF